MKKIAVIDYGFGNLKSVLNALNFLGAQGTLVTEAGKISAFDGAILPGVGAFAPAAQFLSDKNFDGAILDYVKSGKMLYGICLGFQLFFTKSYENGRSNGLNIVCGEVKKFESGVEKLKVPHIGWNSVEFAKTDGAKKMFDGIENGADFYFVHSYYGSLQNKEQTSSFCKYGVEFCSSICFDNVWGSQFHPEKSGKFGLKVLGNFIREV